MRKNTARTKIKNETKPKKANYRWVGFGILCITIVIYIIVGVLLCNFFDNIWNWLTIMAALSFGALVTWTAGMYDRVSSYGIDDSFERHGIFINRYNDSEKMIVTSAFIASSFFTVIFILGTFFLIISNIEVLKSVL